MKKLQSALDELTDLDIEAECYICNITERPSVDKLASHAKRIGTICSVIHAADMSPYIGDYQAILELNAIGTININEAFYEVMEEDSSIIDIASMAGYMLPKFLIPIKSYQYSRLDKKKFSSKMMARINFFPKHLRSEIAYSISKNFVIWYAKTDAAKFGRKGIRIISISPGSFKIPMGKVKKDSAKGYTEYCAIKQSGHVEEIANLLSFCASNEAGYLTGIDILYDGGLIAFGFNPLKHQH